MSDVVITINVTEISGGNNKINRGDFLVPLAEIKGFLEAILNGSQVWGIRVGAPATPASGYMQPYFLSDGLYMKNSAGVATKIGPTLGLDATFITKTPSTDLANEVALSSFATGFLHVTNGTGALITTKSQLAATTNPGSNDDALNGYAVGSRWINVTQDLIWECVEATTGAAIWKLLTLDQIAVLEDQKAQNAAGGASVATTWTKRDLNTELADPFGLVALDGATGRFTPVAGKFKIKVWSPVMGGASTQTAHLRLYNNTAASEIGRSINYTLLTNQGDVMEYEDVFTANGTDAYEIQYYSTLARSTDGLGRAVNETSQVERYTRVELQRLG